MKNRGGHREDLEPTRTHVLERACEPVLMDRFVEQANGTEKSPALDQDTNILSPHGPYPLTE